MEDLITAVACANCVSPVFNNVKLPNEFAEFIIEMI